MRPGRRQDRRGGKVGQGQPAGWLAASETRGELEASFPVGRSPPKPMPRGNPKLKMPLGIL